MTKEHDLINRYFAPLCSNEDEAPAFGLLDDTALLHSKTSGDLLITSDALVADVHFFANDPAAAIAHKALAVNVSDIVAKGGHPTHYLLTLALPTDLDGDWLSEFSNGLAKAQKLYDCQLVGGDTVSTSGPLMISITLLGDLVADKMVRRSGAAAGDHVFVSGTIGDAALGLLLRLNDEKLASVDLSEEYRSHLLEGYLLPAPSCELAPLVANYASAAMDISDGLAGDFAKLCAASKVGGVINTKLVPLSDAATNALAQSSKLLENVITGGDDYQLLVTVPASKADEFQRSTSKMTRIGEIVPADEGVVVLGADGKPFDLAHGAFDHFRAKGQ